MTKTQHTATKLTKPGSIPVWEYRGVRISSSAGTGWGRGWLLVTNNTRFYLTTLEAAKFHVDCFIEDGGVVA